MNRNQKIISVITLGILWGAAEILVGNLVQSVALPIRGIILTVITIFFIITTKKLAGFPGSILLLGLIVIILKAVYYQSIFHSALLAVLLLVVLAEILMSAISDFKKASTITSICLMLYTYAHCIIMHDYYFGRNVYSVYRNLVYGSWGIDFSIEVILFFFLIVNLLLGAVAGIIFFKLSSKIEKSAVDYFE